MVEGKQETKKVELTDEQKKKAVISVLNSALSLALESGLKVTIGNDSFGNAGIIIKGLMFANRELKVVEPLDRMKAIIEGVA